MNAYTRRDLRPRGARAAWEDLRSTAIAGFFGVVVVGRTTTADDLFLYIVPSISVLSSATPYRRWSDGARTKHTAAESAAPNGLPVA